MRPILKKILRLAAWLVGILVLSLYLLLPAGMGLATVLPAKAAVGAPPQGFQEISLPASGGVTLAAWYLPPQNGAVIVLLHGAGGSRQDVRPYAEMLARGGFGVLALDQRGHGMSGGRTNRLGWEGSADVAAAVQFLQSRPEVQHIGGLGLSMGGEVLLGAASQFPQVSAIASDGATRRCTQELLALPSERPLVRNFTARVMFAAVRLFSGQKPPQPTLLDSMQTAPDARFLWIAAGANALEAEFNRLFAETIGGRGELWIAEGAPHVGAFSLRPQEYEQKVLTFFRSALLESSTP